MFNVSKVGSYKDLARIADSFGLKYDKQSRKQSIWCRSCWGEVCIKPIYSK
jgi:hypothetical protein